MTEEWLAEGDLTYVQGDEAIVRGAQEYPAVPFVAPYGIFALPPQGGRAVVFCNGHDVWGAGVPMRGEKAAPGELLLESEGGAYLLLKKDGTAVLNGQQFPPATREDS